MAFKCNNKSLSVFVAWFNIFMSFAVPIGVYAYTWYAFAVWHGSTDLRNPLRPQFFILCASVLPWLFASIFLLKGIKQDRPKLMKPWIYIACFYVFMSCAAMVATIYNMTVRYTFETGVHQSLPAVIAMIVMILCIIPVKKLYNHMTLPPSPPPVPVVESTQVVLLDKKVEADPRYIPIFEEY